MRRTRYSRACSLGITDLVNGTVRLRRNPVAQRPLDLCVAWRDGGCWCDLWGEIHILTGNICFHLLQHQHEWETWCDDVSSISQARAVPGMGTFWTGSTMWPHLSKYGHSKPHYLRVSWCCFFFQTKPFLWKPVWLSLHVFLALCFLSLIPFLFWISMMGVHFSAFILHHIFSHE